ncbi:uncharacterized protein LOC125372725 [Haliotis rufescens]|uniref:uncharacterized protein LOC125372215 n=1 Tax=Haliotis rufescens TaxID=6454 RepID=UPI001EB0739A|nr:uncharacterized protein LOC125372215 [Haliotis rufescens]XP_048239169.1 uncharacterized protein LOC125372725 [Haliotis rufescens]
MEFSKEEMEKMIVAFEKAGLKPKADTVEGFKDWITSVSEQEVIIKQEVDLGVSASVDDVAPTSSTTQQKSVSTHAYHSFPKLTVFSGEPGKDSEYDLWRYEVDCLIEAKTHSNEVILQAIRKSLKGEAALSAMKLGHKASITDILSKLKSAFGTLRRISVLMSEFYSATQKDGEDVTAWSCRLERLLYQLVCQKSISHAEQDDMLRSRLWDGLNPTLKGLAGYKYESLKNFDDLRLCLRELEFDLHRGTVPQHKGKQAMVKQASSEKSTEPDHYSELKDMLKQMKSEITGIKDHQTQMTTQINQLQSGQPDVRPRGRGRSGYRGAYGSTQDTSTSVNQSESASGSDPSQESIQQRPLPVCWNCGYPGHLSYGCRVRQDHRRRPLNSNRPMGRGHS